MIQGMVGKKLGMTQVFDDNGVALPVTVIECGPNVVTQIRTAEKDGYEAVQLGFGISKRLNRPEQGHRKASGFMSDVLREVKASEPRRNRGRPAVSRPTRSRPASWSMSRRLSKGRGFQGGMKRHGFQRRSEDSRSVGPLAGARLDRFLGDAGPRLQGHQDGRPHGATIGSPCRTSRLCASTPSAICC